VALVAQAQVAVLVVIEPVLEHQAAVPRLNPL
jgi:hypothetical protein